MKMTHRKWATRIVVLLMLLGIVIWGRRISLMLKGFSNLTVYHDFVISGKVVDENGNPFDGVKVEATTGRNIKAGFESETKSLPAINANPSFKFEFDQYSDVLLTFFAKGYRTKSLDFIGGGKHEGMTIVLKPLTGDPDKDGPEYGVGP